MGKNEGATAAPNAGYTVQDFVEHSGAGASTLKMYSYQLGQVETWIGKALASATERDVVDLKARLYKMKSGHQYAGLLRMYFGAAKRDDLRALLKMKQKSKARLAPGDVLSVDDVQKMIESALSARDAALIACLWESGVRIHEVLALDLNDIRETDSPENGRQKMYVLWFRKTKTDTPHEGYVIEGAPVLSRWIKAHPLKRPDSPVFCTYHGTRLDPVGGWRVVKSAAKRAQIAKRTFPHLFRHSRATFLLRSGMKELDVKRLLGWAPGSRILEAKYAHLADRDTKRALFTALGMKAPESVDLGKLDFSEDAMRPVVPLNPPPGAKVNPLEAEMAALRAQVAVLQRGFESAISSVAVHAGIPPGSTVSVEVAEEGPKALIITAAKPEGGHRQIVLQEPGSNAVQKVDPTAPVPAKAKGKKA